MSESDSLFVTCVTEYLLDLNVNLVIDELEIQDREIERKHFLKQVLLISKVKLDPFNPCLSCEMHSKTILNQKILKNNKK